MSRTPQDAGFDVVAQEAQRLVKEGIEHGQLTLKSGKILVLETEQVVRLAQWAAGQAPKRPKFVEAPEGFHIKETRHSSP